MYVFLESCTEFPSNIDDDPSDCCTTMAEAIEACIDRDHQGFRDQFKTDSLDNPPTLQTFLPTSSVDETYEKVCHFLLPRLPRSFRFAIVSCLLVLCRSQAKTRTHRIARVGGGGLAHP